MASAVLTFDDGSNITLQDSDLTGSDGYGYAESLTVDGTAFDYRFLGYIWALVRHGQALYRAFSTTSLTIGTGSKTFTATKYRPYFVGAWVRAEDASNSANYMEGEVTAYNADTGALTVNVTDTGGSGTIADWNITSAGKRGATGDTGGISGGTLTGDLDFDGNDAQNIGAASFLETAKGTIADAGSVEFDVSAASVQTVTFEGSATITFTGWADSGTESGVLIKVTDGSNLGTTDLDGINWFIGDGTTSTTFEDTGITLGSYNELIISSSDAGTTKYGVAN